MKQLSLLEQARLRFPERDDPDHVAELAADVIRELAEEPPIDLRVIASYRDISEIRLEDMPSSGSLAPEGGRFVMRLNRHESHSRQRFTGFHEVGHTFLPGYADHIVLRCQPVIVRPMQRKYTVETLADVAASEFLLPSAFVRHDLAAGDFGTGAVEALAQRYDAGIHASANRFVQLWPEPSLLVVLAVCNKPRDGVDVEPQLRVQATWAQPQMHWTYVPKWKSATPDGPLSRALAGELIHERASLEELGLHDSTPLELSARAFGYRVGGDLRHRVFALYRRWPLRPGKRKDASG
jgi:hypothetical protein